MTIEELPPKELEKIQQDEEEEDKMAIEELEKIQQDEEEEDKNAE